MSARFEDPGLVKVKGLFFGRMLHLLEFVLSSFSRLLVLVCGWLIRSLSLGEFLFFLVGMLCEEFRLVCCHFFFPSFPLEEGSFPGGTRLGSGILCCECFKAKGKRWGSSILFTLDLLRFIELHMKTEITKGFIMAGFMGRSFILSSPLHDCKIMARNAKIQFRFLQLHPHWSLSS
jgi:hypothetical protein